MTNQQKAKAEFVKRYGKMGEYLDCNAWLGWLGVYLAGWTDAEEQACSLCGDQVSSAPDLCWACYHLETASDAE